MSVSESRIEELRSIRRASSVREIGSKFKGTSVPETRESYQQRIRKTTKSDRAMLLAMNRIADPNAGDKSTQASTETKLLSTSVAQQDWSDREMNSIMIDWARAMRKEKPGILFTADDAKSALEVHNITASTVSSSQWSEWEKAVDWIVQNQNQNQNHAKISADSNVPLGQLDISIAPSSSSSLSAPPSPAKLSEHGLVTTPKVEEFIHNIDQVEDDAEVTPSGWTMQEKRSLFDKPDQPLPSGLLPSGTTSVSAAAALFPDANSHALEQAFKVPNGSVPSTPTGIVAARKHSFEGKSTVSPALSPKATPTRISPVADKMSTPSKAISATPDKQRQQESLNNTSTKPLQSTPVATPSTAKVALPSVAKTAEQAASSDEKVIEPIAASMASTSATATINTTVTNNTSSNNKKKKKNKKKADSQSLPPSTQAPTSSPAVASSTIGTTSLQASEKERERQSSAESFSVLQRGTAVVTQLGNSAAQTTITPPTAPAGSSSTTTTPAKAVETSRVPTAEVTESTTRTLRTEPRPVFTPPKDEEEKKNEVESGSDDVDPGVLRKLLTMLFLLVVGGLIFVATHSDLITSITSVTPEISRPTIAVDQVDMVSLLVGSSQQSVVADEITEILSSSASPPVISSASSDQTDSQSLHPSVVTRYTAKDTNQDTQQLVASSANRDEQQQHHSALMATTSKWRIPFLQGAFRRLRNLFQSIFPWTKKA